MGQIQKSFSASFISDGSAKVFNLAYLPRSVFMLNKTSFEDQTDNDVNKAWGFSSDANGVAYVDVYGAAGAVEADRISSGGFSFITRDTPRFGAAVSASGANSVDKDADFMAVNITSHGFQTGDVVLLSSTTGMLQIAGVPYTVTRVNANQFTIPIDTSAYTFAADATAVTAKQLLYPDLYLPYIVYPTGITQAAQAVVTTNIDHKFVKGSRVKFKIPDDWGMIELNDLEGTVLSVGNIDNAQAYTEVTDGGAVNAFRVDINTSGFTAFDYPTSAVADAGMDFPQVWPIGDVNFGFIGPVPDTPPPLGIPGAFVANTGYQVIIGTGVAGTAVMHADEDVVEVHFDFPEQLGDSVAYAP